MGEARVVRRGLCFWLACRKTFAARGKSSRLKPLPQGHKQRLAASAAPTRLEESMHSLLILNLTFGAPPKRRRRRTDPAGAPRMDARRFPRGQDAPSENPAGSANPVRSTGRSEEHTSELQSLMRISYA